MITKLTVLMGASISLLASKNDTFEASKEMVFGYWSFIVGELSINASNFELQIMPAAWFITIAVLFFIISIIGISILSRDQDSVSNNKIFFPTIASMASLVLMMIIWSSILAKSDNLKRQFKSFSTFSEMSLNKQINKNIYDSSPDIIPASRVKLPDNFDNMPNMIPALIVDENGNIVNQIYKRKDKTQSIRIKNGN